MEGWGRGELAVVRDRVMGSCASSMAASSASIQSSGQPIPAAGNRLGVRVIDEVAKAKTGQLVWVV